MDTARKTEKSTTSTYLAVTLIIRELKASPFSQLSEPPWLVLLNSFPKSFHYC